MNTRDRVGEVVLISAHCFRLLCGTQSDAVAPCSTKDIQIHETAHPGPGQ